MLTLLICELLKITTLMIYVYRLFNFLLINLIVEIYS